MNKELEQLVNYAIADGVITDKEREILRRKAEQMGYDPDEIDMILEGRLGEKLQRDNFNTLKSQMRKCPNCGEAIPITSGICPSCGFAFDNEGKDLKLLSDLDDIYKKISKSKKFSDIYLHALVLSIILAVFCLIKTVADGSEVPIDEIMAMGFFLVVTFCIYLLCFRIYSRKEPADAKKDIGEFIGQYESALANAKHVYSKDKKINERIADIEMRANKEFRLRQTIKKSFLVAIAVFCVISVIFFFMPNPKVNGYDCNKKVVALLDDGNFNEALKCIEEFDFNNAISNNNSSYENIIRYGIKKGKIEEVKQVIKKTVPEDEYESKDLVQNLISVCLECDSYDMAKFLYEEYELERGHRISKHMAEYLINRGEYNGAKEYWQGYDYLKAVVKHMCENNKKEEARNFVKRETDGIKDRKERQEQKEELNDIINRY